MTKNSVLKDLFARMRANGCESSCLAVIETFVLKDMFDRLRAAVEEGVYLPVVDSSTEQGTMILDLALIREVEPNGADEITEILVIEGEFTCQSLEDLDWLIVTWRSDDEINQMLTGV